MIPKFIFPLESNDYEFFVLFPLLTTIFVARSRTFHRFQNSRRQKNLAEPVNRFRKVSLHRPTGTSQQPARLFVREPLQNYPRNQCLRDLIPVSTRSAPRRARRSPHLRNWKRCTRSRASGKIRFPESMATALLPPTCERISAGSLPCAADRSTDPDSLPNPMPPPSNRSTPPENSPRPSRVAPFPANRGQFS